MKILSHFILDTNIRLVTVEEEVVAQEAQLEALEQSDIAQNDRMSVLEDDVDTWDDRIVALEATDQDIQGRLVTLEETILSNLRAFSYFSASRRVNSVAIANMTNNNAVIFSNKE